MELSEVKVGQQVVVNSLPDTIIYTVESLDGYTAKLSYESSQGKVSGGYMDVSVLKKPNAKQRKAAMLS